MHPSSVGVQPPSPRVVVVVPTYNEKMNVEELVGKVEEARADTGGELEILFVDDSSPDGTADVVREIGRTREWMHLLSRPGKKGIGSAYLDGFREAISSLNADVLVEMDADLQHPPALIRVLVAAVNGGADVAVASRYVPGGGVRGWSRGRRVVSGGANGFARSLLGIKAKDATSGFRAYSRASAESLLSASLPARGFEFQVASLHALGRGAKVVEIPYTFEPRKAGESKLGVKDVLRFFFAVLRIAAT